MSDSNSTPEELRNERDKENRERVICNQERVDFTKARATDFNQNKYIVMPGPVDIREEVRIQAQKDTHMDVIREYMRTNCDKDGNMKGSENMTKSELEGRRQVREGIASKGWMLYQTDKSGKLCLDTVSNFEECMAGHVLKDPIVTPEMVKKGEK